MSARAIVILAFAAALPAGAASIQLSVKDARGAAVEDAVVWAVPKVAPPARARREAAVEQKDKQFRPMVTVVQTGTLVRFPNRDEIRHHVYSFSAPKPFEIKLYAGTAAAPILFDKPGEVVLGCNIHDNMLGYIYVVDTPWFAKTRADGSARLDDLPEGDYELQVWHYAQAAASAALPAKLRADESLPTEFIVPLKALPPRPGPR
jgi:plastocyanin